MYRDKPCAKCGNIFSPRSSNALFCMDCKMVPCQNCGNLFEVASMKLNMRFCSLACRSAYRFRGMRFSMDCCYCGKQISKPLSALKKKRSGELFCSRTCRTKFYWENAETRQQIIDGIKANPSLHTEARKIQLDEARAKRKPMTEETRQLIRQARLRQKFPVRMTSIEQALYDEFTKRRLTFEMHRTMFGRWQPDFVFESARLIVQADGDYWHSRPGAKENDEAFNHAAEIAGWCVWRFSEKVIKQDTTACARSVARFVHDYAPTGSSISIESSASNNVGIDVD